MRWTIRLKLISVGVVAFIGLSVLAATFFVVDRFSVEKSAISDQAEEYLKLVNQAHALATEMSLVAMDTIVDKDDGAVSAERRKAMDDGLSQLARLTTQLAARAVPGIERDQAGKVIQDTDALSRAMRDGLVSAVENRAGHDRFAALDDEIDGLADAIKDGLDVIATQVAARAAKAEAEKREWMASSRLVTGAAYGVTLLVMAFILAVVGRAIIGPIQDLTNVMGRLAAGDTGVALPRCDGGDEMTAMVAATAHFRDEAVKKVALEADAARIGAQAEAERRRALEQVADDIDRQVQGAVRTIVDGIGKVHDLTSMMAERARETTQTSTAIAAATHHAAGNVQSVAGAAEELGIASAEIARQVSHATRVTQSAVQEAAAARGVMDGLSTAADHIGQVVALIGDIAAQTNLLALNATIEAARAGDAGKGFAVVAGEVKNLAGQTARATEEITQQISGLRQSVEDAVAAIGRIAGTIEAVNGNAAAIAGAVEQQAATIAGVSDNTTQAADASRDVSAKVDGISHGATAALESAAGIERWTQDLVRQADDLARQVENFAIDIRRTAAVEKTA